MRLKKILAAFAVSLTLAGAAVAIPATPASAAPQGCLRGYTCMYTGANYTGWSSFWNALADANLGCHSLVGLPLNNSIESIYTFTYTSDRRWIGWFNSHNCTGDVMASTQGSAWPTLPPSQQNRYSSWKLLRV
jgi:hypothetical protein